MSNIKHVKSRVAVFGEVFSPNLGDGVIFECVKHLFAMQGVEAFPVDLSGRKYWDNSVHSKSDDRSENFVRTLLRAPMRKSQLLRKAYSAFRWYLRVRKSVREEWEKIVLDSDAIVIGGGQLLTDVNFGFPPKVYEVFLLARRHNKPLAIFGCGVGAKWSYIARKMYVDVLQYADYISLRDRESLRMISLNAHWVSGKINVHPDPAFIVSHVYGKGSSPEKSDTLGVNFQPAEHFRAFVPELKHLSDSVYFEFWRELIRGAAKTRASVVVMTNGDILDYHSAKIIVDSLIKEGVNVTLNQRPVIPSQLADQIDEVSDLISTRMHAGIIAYGLGKSVTPVAWDGKIRNVWAVLGLEKAVVPAVVVGGKSSWREFSDSYSGTRACVNNLNNVVGEVFAASKECVSALGLSK